MSATISRQIPVKGSDAIQHPGILADATANGIRMGQRVPFTSGDLSITLDLDIAGADARPLLVQVLASGTPMPTILDEISITVGPRGTASLTVPHDVADGRWIVLRVTDPSQAPDGRATGAFATAGRALVYTSPFFLDPDA